MGSGTPAEKVAAGLGPQLARRPSPGAALLALPGRAAPLGPVEHFVAATALAVCLAHNVRLWQAGHWYNVFWSCDLAALLVGPALWLRWRRIACVCLIWLARGVVVWTVKTFLVADYALSIAFFSSLLLHYGCGGAALLAVRRLGYDPRCYPTAMAMELALLVFSRAALPVAANVNAAWSVPSEWVWGGTYQRFLAFYALLSLTLSGLAALLAARVGRRRSAARP